MNRFLFGVICLLGLTLLPSQVRAQSCSATVGDMVFSGDPTGDLPLESSMKVRVKCNASLLGSAKKILFCAHLNQGTGGGDAYSRQMVNGTDTLDYQIYNEQDASTVAGSLVYPPAPVVRHLSYTSLLLLLGNTEAEFKLYGRVLPNQVAIPGKYISDFNDAFLLYGGDDCNGGTGALTFIDPFRVSLDVIPSCRVTATSVNFGEQGALLSDLDASGKVNVTCTKDTIYKVTLGQGLAAAGVNGRKMFKDGARGSPSIAYNLFRDPARTIVWDGIIPPDTSPWTKIATGTTDAQTVYARVKAQKTPPAGTYSDSVVVNVYY